MNTIVLILSLGVIVIASGFISIDAKLKRIAEALESKNRREP